MHHRKPSRLPCFLLSLLICLLSSPALQAGQLVMLQYHHIDTDTPASTSLSPALFREHMQHLEREGFTVLRLEEALSDIRAGRDLPDRSVSITFDDGYLSVYTDAFPVLRELEFPFTVFVTAGLTGDTPGLYASWEQLREMGENGATLANHSMSHPYFLDRAPGESDSAWLAGVEAEIVDAEEIIEQQTGQRHGLIAYPYGEYSPAIQALVSELGFIGIGQQSGPVNETSDFTALPRFPFSGIYASMNTFPERITTLAFNIEDVEPHNRNTSSSHPEATIVFGPGDYRLPAITCFHNNQPMQLSIDDNRLHLSSTQESRSRRFRYNCTAPGGDGRYYWYSVDWVNPAISE